MNSKRVQVLYFFPEFCIFSILGAGTPAVSYDYGYGRTPQTYDASKTYYQQAPTTATYAAAAQTYDATQTAAKVSLYYFLFNLRLSNEYAYPPCYFFFLLILVL